LTGKPGAESIAGMVEVRPLPSADVVIAGVGARAPCGLTALQVAMCARAGKLAPRESHMVDRDGEPIATARLGSIADNIFGLDRLLALAAPPLLQAAYPWTATASKRPPGGTIRAFVALPAEAREGVDPRLGRHLLPALAARTQIPIDVGRSSLVRGCRGGGVIAFELGMKALAAGADAVLVGGVDSYFDPGVLDWLENERRLHGPSTENGFIPGEGASFVLLVPQRRSAAFERLGQIVSASVEDEPRPFGSEEPCLAEGMTKALRRAVAPIGAQSKRIAWALTDVVNERHRLDEWTFALARNHGAFAPDVVHEQPMLKTGDLGAANAATLVTIAVVRWQTRCAESDVAVVTTSSDGPERGAMVISAADAE